MTAPSGKPPGDDAAMAEARRWLVLLQDREADAEVRGRFEAWCAADPAHATAWERTERLWSDLDQIAPILRNRERDRRATAHPRTPVRRAPVRTGPVMLGRRAWLGGALAASAAVVAGLDYLKLAPWHGGDLRTAAGERRIFRLPDGSTAELGGRSALAVTMAEERRALTLLEGEAFFSVAPDPARPFSVRAAGGETRALGTAFSVKIEEAQVAVTVAEHAVEVRSGYQGPAVVRQGQRLVYGRDGFGSLQSVDLGLALSWREDRLIFQEAPLARVLADLERYRPGRILVTDAAVGAIPVSGAFDAHRTDEALETIADTLPVRVTWLTRFLVIVSGG